MMKKSSMLSVTVGIPAYLAEDNIKNLLASVITQIQDETFHIDNIIVYYDHSGDSTLQKAKEVTDRRIRIIDGKVRKGFANGVRTLLSQNKSNIMLLLNDDIKITDRYFIKKIVNCFTETDVGLVCANPQPLKPKTFIDQALSSRLKASENLSLSINHGSNVFSCDGKVMALSNRFINRLRFPSDNKTLGNVDAYLYFSCITLNFKYKFVPEAHVYFRNPTTVNDYMNWVGRNNAQRYILSKVFGAKLVNREYRKPVRILLYTSLIEFIKNPVGSLFIIVFELLLIAKSRSFYTKNEETWEVIKSTKYLS